MPLVLSLKRGSGWKASSGNLLSASQDRSSGDHRVEEALPDPEQSCVVRALSRQSFCPRLGIVV